MIEIKVSEYKDVTLIDARLRQSIADKFIGLSAGGFGTIAYLDDTANQQTIDTATESLNSAETLSIAATKTEVIADGVDESIITCIELGNVFDFVIYLNGAIDSNGSVADGTLELSLVQAGDYLVEITNPANYETGVIEIEGLAE